MIKNVLLDLGGVIMDIKRQYCVDAFTALGMKDADTFFTDSKQKGPFLALECGQITPDEFHDEIRRMLPEGVTDEQIDTALDRFLIGIPADRLRQLDDLRRDYKVYMLSNTNRIMWDTFIVPQFTQLGKTMNDYFDGIITSFDAKVCKPDAGIYRYAIEKLGIKPEETIFLDDAAGNIEAAKALGFNTALVAGTPRPYREYLA